MGYCANTTEFLRILEYLTSSHRSYRLSYQFIAQKRRLGDALCLPRANHPEKCGWSSDSVSCSQNVQLLYWIVHSPEVEKLPFPDSRADSLVVSQCAMTAWVRTRGFRVCLAGIAMRSSTPERFALRAKGRILTHQETRSRTVVRSSRGIGRSRVSSNNPPCPIKARSARVRRSPASSRGRIKSITLV